MAPEIGSKVIINKPHPDEGKTAQVICHIWGEKFSLGIILEDGRKKWVHPEECFPTA